jgi:hypothetical protein
MIGFPDFFSPDDADEGVVGEAGFFERHQNNTINKTTTAAAPMYIIVFLSSCSIY